MALETYQDLVSSEPNEVQDASFATIAEIYSDGVTLIFDGMTEATTKRYLTNSFVVFKVGDRVRVIKDSGTYIVEYPVGVPRLRFDATYAASANYANSAGSASSTSWATYARCLTNQGVQGASPLYLAYQNGGFYIRYGTSGSWYKINT